MSIAARSVLGRILDEVRHGDGLAALGPRVSSRSADEIIALRTTSAAYAPPFATSLHFWAYALRDLLAELSRPDAFDALAGNCLCQPVEGDVVAGALADLSRRAQPPLPSQPQAGYTAGYRMIDQDVMASWLAEGPRQFVAAFWLRPSWLAEARHIPRE